MANDIPHLLCLLGRQGWGYIPAVRKHTIRPARGLPFLRCVKGNHSPCPRPTECGAAVVLALAGIGQIIEVIVWWLAVLPQCGPDSPYITLGSEGIILRVPPLIDVGCGAVDHHQEQPLPPWFASSSCPSRLEAVPFCASPVACCKCKLIIQSNTITEPNANTHQRSIRHV